MREVDIEIDLSRYHKDVYLETLRKHGQKWRPRIKLPEAEHIVTIYSEAGLVQNQIIVCTTSGLAILKCGKFFRSFSPVLIYCPYNNVGDIKIRARKKKASFVICFGRARVTFLVDLRELHTLPSSWDFTFCSSILAKTSFAPSYLAVSHRQNKEKTASLFRNPGMLSKNIDSILDCVKQAVILHCLQKEVNLVDDYLADFDKCYVGLLETYRASFNEDSDHRGHFLAWDHVAKWDYFGLASYRQAAWLNYCEEDSNARTKRWDTVIDLLAECQRVYDEEISAMSSAYRKNDAALRFGRKEYTRRINRIISLLASTTTATAEQANMRFTSKEDAQVTRASSESSATSELDETSETRVDEQAQATDGPCVAEQGMSGEMPSPARVTEEASSVRKADSVEVSDFANCPHCSTSGVLPMPGNLCPNCKESLES